MNGVPSSAACAPQSDSISLLQATTCSECIPVPSAPWMKEYVALTRTSSDLHQSYYPWCPSHETGWRKGKYLLEQGIIHIWLLEMKTPQNCSPVSGNLIKFHKERFPTQTWSMTERRGSAEGKALKSSQSRQLHSSTVVALALHFPLGIFHLLFAKLAACVLNSPRSSWSSEPLY